MVFKAKKSEKEEVQEEPATETQEEPVTESEEVVPDRQEIRDVIEGHLNRAIALLRYL